MTQYANKYLYVIQRTPKLTPYSNGISPLKLAPFIFENFPILYSVVTLFSDESYKIMTSQTCRINIFVND